MKRVCENWILAPRRFLRSQGLTTKWNCVKHLQIFKVMIQRSLQSCVRGASCLSCVELGGRGSHGQVNPIIYIYIYSKKSIYIYIIIRISPRANKN